MRKTNTTQFPRLVAFFGPDGAGKSTQAKLLVDYLRSNDFAVKQAWVRSVHSFAFFMWVLFRRLNLLHQRSSIPFQGIAKPAISYLREDSYGAVSPISMNPPILKGRISRFIWSTMEIISIIPVIILQVYIPLLKGRYVVAERYVVDSVTTIAYFVGNPHFVRGSFAKLLLAFIPKGTVFVYIDADYDAIVERRGNVAGPYEYTEFHRRLYKELTPIVRAIYVNTSKASTQETHQRILNSIERRIREKALHSPD